MMQKGNSSRWHSLMREMAFPPGVHIKLHLNLVSLSPSHSPRFQPASPSDHILPFANFLLSFSRCCFIFSVMNNFTARNNVMMLCMRGATEAGKFMVNN